MNRTLFLTLAIALLTGCTHSETRKSEEVKAEPPPPSYYKVDPATAGMLAGVIHFAGRKPARKPVNMGSEPQCAGLHQGGGVLDESLLVGRGGALENVFVYVKTGLEDKTFEPPATPVTIDQKGCWFTPRVLGIKTGQTLQVTNSDPVTHNIHPQAEANREWNQSQGQGDPPLTRHFVRPEILIPVKCNIHRWMHAFIGVVDHPYFAVSRADGTFEMANVPPGTYTIEAVHETLGRQQQEITVKASEKVSVNFTFKGE